MLVAVVTDPRPSHVVGMDVIEEQPENILTVLVTELNSSHEDGMDVINEQL